MLKTLTLVGVAVAFMACRGMAQGESAAARSIAIIVAKSCSLENLSAEELRKIFMAEKKTGPDGHRFKVIMRDPGTPERNAVLSTIFHMSESEYSRFFLQAVFTGTVQAAPKQIGPAAAVRAFVAATPGAIAYIRGDEADDSVKVVKVEGKAPGDADYKLKLAAP